MATVTLLAQQTLAAGIYQYAQTSIPDASTQLSININHGGGVVPGMWWGVVVSTDGGVTWVPTIAAATYGQQPTTFSSMTGAIPAGTGRLAKAFLWLLGSQNLSVTATVV